MTSIFSNGDVHQVHPASYSKLVFNSDSAAFVPINFRWPAVAFSQAIICHQFGTYKSLFLLVGTSKGAEISIEVEVPLSKVAWHNMSSQSSAESHGVNKGWHESAIRS